VNPIDPDKPDGSRRPAPSHPQRGKAAPVDDLAWLITRHPLLFRGAPPRVASHLPPGWAALVDGLCTDLERLLGPQGCQPFVVDQIKEKLGALRFYWSLGQEADLVVDMMSTQGYATLTIKGGSSPLFQSVRQRVAAAMQASASTCQECGSRGTLRNIDGRLVTLCDHHDQLQRG
jgi:hypothetical protein